MSTNTEQIKFYKGLESKLPTGNAIEIGALYHCTDTNNTYLGVLNPLVNFLKLGEGQTVPVGSSYTNTAFKMAAGLGGLTEHTIYPIKKSIINNTITSYYFALSGSSYVSLDTTFTTKAAASDISQLKKNTYYYFTSEGTVYKTADLLPGYELYSSASGKRQLGGGTTYDEGDAEGLFSFAGGSSDKRLASTIVGYDITDTEWLENLGIVEFSPAEKRLKDQIGNVPKATGEVSLTYGSANNSVTALTSTIGFGSTAGARGFYIQKLELLNQNNKNIVKVTLTDTQLTNISGNSSSTSIEFSVNSRSWGTEAQNQLAKLEVMRSSSKLDNDASIILRKPYIAIGEIISINSVDGTIEIDNTDKRITSADLQDFLNSSSSINIPYNYTLYIPCAADIGIADIHFGGLATGLGSSAAGTLSQAHGKMNTAAGQFSFAIGQNNIAGYGAFASGESNRALGIDSHAEGIDNDTRGSCAHAEGTHTTAYGNYTHAEGHSVTNFKDATVYTLAHEFVSTETYYKKENKNFTEIELTSETFKPNTYYILATKLIAGDIYNNWKDKDSSTGKYSVAYGNCSHVEGQNSLALGARSHAEGWMNTALGTSTHAEGRETLAKGLHSHTQGRGTVALGENSHVLGKYNKYDAKIVNGKWVGLKRNVDGTLFEDENGNNVEIETDNIAEATSNNTYAVIVGNGTSTSNRSNAHTLDWEGNAWFAGHIANKGTYSLGSYFNSAGNKDGYAIEINDGAVNTYVVLKITGHSYSINKDPINSMYQFFLYPTYNNNNGIITRQSGVSFGYDLGPLTVYRSNNKFYAHIAPKIDYQILNFELLSSSTNLTPKVIPQAIHEIRELEITIKPFVKMTRGTGENAEIFNNAAVADGNNSHAEGNNTAALGVNAHAEGGGNVISVQITGAANVKTYTLNEKKSNIKAGQIIKCDSTYATITAYDASKPSITVNNTLSKSEAVSNKTVSIYSLSASGTNAHAEGYMTIASATGAHAEGQLTSASGTNAHAEGYMTVASGLGAHAEGRETIASGERAHAEGYLSQATNNYSHAEGKGTFTSGESSHVEGLGTIANAEAQHVQGKYNKEDNTKAFIIGGGSSSSDRKNIMTVDWKGNISSNNYRGQNTYNLGSYYGLGATPQGYLFDLGPTSGSLMVTFKITGHSYAKSNQPFDTTFQFYAWDPKYQSNGIPFHATSYSGVTLGADVGDFTAFYINDGTEEKADYHLYMYLNETGIYQTYNFELITNTALSNPVIVERTNVLPEGVPAEDSPYRIKITPTRATAAALTTNAGSKTKPVYFANGIPVECDNTIDITHPNGFSKIIAGTDNVIAGSSESVVTLQAGNNIAISGNDETNTITINVNGLGNLAHKNESDLNLKELAHKDLADLNLKELAHKDLAEILSNEKAKENGTVSAGTATTAARADHVHPLQASVSGNAGTADKVNQSLKIQLNGGTTEDTNQFTFDGSAVKTINITPSAIGAAASAHDHSNYKNQNAFSKVKIGSSTIEAETTTDTLTLASSGIISLTADTTNDKVTIGTSYIRAGSGDQALILNYDSSEPSYANGEQSLAEGSKTEANGRMAHSEGRSTKANGNFSHAEGVMSYSQGVASHAEGWYTKAHGQGAHSEGSLTYASGEGAHAEGCSTQAYGQGSHVEGIGTQTDSSATAQHVQGEYNIVMPNKYLHVVGAGSSSTRKNIHTLDRNGQAWFAGSIYLGGEYDTYNGEYTGAKTVATDKDISKVWNDIRYQYCNGICGGLGIEWGTEDPNDPFPNPPDGMIYFKIID